MRQVKRILPLDGSLILFSHWNNWFFVVHSILTRKNTEFVAPKNHALLIPQLWNAVFWWDSLKLKQSLGHWIFLINFSIKIRHKMIVDLPHPSHYLHNTLKKWLISKMKQLENSLLTIVYIHIGLLTSILRIVSWSSFQNADTLLLYE